MIYKKLSASGNDFLIFHSFVKRDYSGLAKKLCDRKYGFGADGLIVLLPHSEYDFEWDFYNSDGSSADMCGNGARASALYAYRQNLCGQTQKFLTKAGVIEAEIFEDNQVEVTLTKPQTLQNDVEGYCKIDTGVPHLTLKTDISTFDLSNARRLRQIYDANVNHYNIVGDEIYVRTYERGVEDETLACGTGMAACVWSIAKEQNLKSVVFKVRPKSSEVVQISLNGECLKLRGFVTVVGECLTKD